jgi:hypothetical protein
MSTKNRPLFPPTMPEVFSVPEPEPLPEPEAEIPIEAVPAEELSPLEEMPPEEAPEEEEEIPDNKGISRPEITERTKRLIRGGMSTANKGLTRLLSAVPLPKRAVSSGGDDLSDLFEVPDEHDNDMEVDDLLDTDIDDLVDVGEEDVYGGGDLSDVLSVSHEDIMGEKSRVKYPTSRRRVIRGSAPTSMGGINRPTF